MSVLENKTGFAAELFTAQDARGYLYVVLVVRGTFEIAPGGVVRRSDDQEPVCSGDVYYGEPLTSSLKSASDLVPIKMGTDIAMLGTAYAPEGKSTRQMIVDLRVGPVQKTVMVFGDRVWSRGVGGVSMTRPDTFRELPLVYERAFGGTDVSHENPSKHDWERRNPVGMGFRVHKALDGLPLPNLEAPHDLITSPSDRPAPQAFGFIDRSWEPRASYVGTYDDKWRTDQCPLLPPDYDVRHFHTVQPDLTSRSYLRGDEPVRIVGAVPEGVLQFELPARAIGVSVEYRHGNPRPGVAQLDTVVLRPDDKKLNLVWRMSVRCPRKIFDVELVTAFTVQLKTALQFVPEFHDRVPDPGTRFGE